jgi:hypothetical protein
MQTESHRPVSNCAKIGTQTSATKYKNLTYLSYTSPIGLFFVNTNLV